ncbi:hypothetical protein LZ30DRAFT_587490 [Colletotrichum cereale]|nr:hypothetical protein LZ30DRAFT_587490 [Colletotrichum cereale]
MVSRRKKAKAKTTATGVKGKNTTEMKDGAGDDTVGEVRDDVEHVTQKEVTMSFQSIEKFPGESYFRRLPLEVRQMIYALAVVEDDPIQPVQVEARANKFQGSKTAAKSFTTLLLFCASYEESSADG